LPGEASQPFEWRLGAVPVEDGVVEFSVWAPRASSAGVRLRGGVRQLQLVGEGVWAARLEAAPGDDYAYVLDGKHELADPCSRSQPDGVDGPSRVVDPRVFDIAPGPALPLEELVIYELHVGTFSPEASFDGVVPRLAELRALGVTAIELMPVATFPGDRGWGYDGIYAYAPHPAYGGPEGFARLVDAAHREGLGVLLDVVYNHLGPGGDAFAAFGPYFTSRHETVWGDAIDYGRRGVREWAIQNAELWTADYRVDGLRLDAVHAVYDDTRPHVLAELKDRVGRALVISEMGHEDWRPVDEWGHDAQWVDLSHHELHVLLTGEHDGYYEPFGSVEALAEDLRGRGHPPERSVVYAQNHDQVGNRAVGDRLPPDAMRVAAAVTLFSPCTPLLFQGEDYGERNPFQFFAHHVDPFVAEATREGRRREFEQFPAFARDDVPDPQAEETFLRSRLSWEIDASTRAFYKRLLELHRKLPRRLEARAEGRTLRLRRGHVELVADFDRRTVELRDA
jgi:maltooligosyltrehalose trehalohydrolase